MWQVRYLVNLEGDFSWQAQHFVTFWEIAGAQNVVFFHTKLVSRMGRVRSQKRRVRDDDFLFGYVRSILGYRRIVFLLAEHFSQFHLKSCPKTFAAGAVLCEVEG